MYSLERTESEIDAIRAKIDAQRMKGGSRWEGMTYEEGCDNMLRWLVGEDDESPYADE